MSANAVCEHPNLLFIMTDQERFMPQEWIEKNLPNMSRLQKWGITFTNAFTCTSMCSPSRTAIFTGRYPAQTGVTKTLGVGERYAPNKYDPTDPELDPRIPNLATMLHKSGCYEKINYLGKWHMSKGFNDVQELLPRQIAAYGFGGWVPPDGGQDWRVSNIAGGYFDKDNAYTNEALKFLQERIQEGSSAKPWCLVLSLINPHDIWTHPKSFGETGYSDEMLQSPASPNSPIPIPDSIHEKLFENGKPSAQWRLKAVQESFIGPIPTDTQSVNDPNSRCRQYLNFYANLLRLVDQQIGSVLDVLETSGLLKSTVIVRTADHGEMGLAHGGLRQKMFNVYEETIHIPLVITSPSLPASSTPRTCDNLVSTIDLLPTIAGLLNVDPPKDLQGKDLSPLFSGGTVTPRDNILFTFDDFRVEANKESAVDAANRIRCIRTSEWKYARYFHSDSSHPEEYEMYYVGAEPWQLNTVLTNNEIDNVAWPESPNYTNPIVVENREFLKAKLAELEKTELPRKSIDDARGPI